MSDPKLTAPLAEFKGQKPPAPQWFSHAIAVEPERGFTEVEGAAVETLTWGKPGKPGLLFLHGGGAHADWWSYIAPFFADKYRIVAPTFTGMGRSDRRTVYRFQQFVREAREAARAGGAFAGGPPVIVGHSFGGRVSMGLAHEFGPEFAAAVLVDPPHFAPENARPPSPPRPSKKRLPHTSLESLVERFYLAPPQLCENLYALDFLARRSAREVVDDHGRHGWELSFDRAFWDRFERVDTAPLLADARCPVALIRGAESKLITAADAAHLMSLIAKDSPHIVIPNARHHVTVDQPLAFVAVLRALLESWPPARQRAFFPHAGARENFVFPRGGREAASP